MTFLKQISLLVLAVCLGLVLVGCQPSDPDAPNVAEVSSIAVTPNPVNLEIGGMQALTVTGTFSDGKSYVVNFGTTFVSSAPAVATVDPNTGYVTAKGNGNATITATHTASGKKATTSVTVAPLRVLSIAVSPATSTLRVGATQALTVTATYNNATTGPVTAGSTFVSSDPTVATVDAAGIVTAIAEGPAVITVTHTASGQSATASVTVSAALTQLTDGVWASNYSQIDAAAWQSIEGGDAGAYIDTSVATQYWWNGVAPNDATPSFYFGYGININAKPWGFGAFVKAPGNGLADVSGYANLKLAVWGNDELMNTHPTLTVILRGATAGGCTAETKGTIEVTAAGAQTYTLPLSGLTLQTACGYASVAQALAAGVSEIHVQVLGDNVQYVTGGPEYFANGLNVGPISFNNDTGGGTAPVDAPATVIPAGSTTIYSDGAVVTGFDSCPNWGQATVCAGEQTIAGNKSLAYTNLNYQGLLWASPVDVSGKGKLHIDFWSPDLTSVKVSLISAGPKENAYTQVLTPGSWNSIDIDLSNYTVPDLAAIAQIKLESATPGTLYVDNIYFWGTPSGGGGGGSSFTPISFDVAGVTYTLTGFGGADDSTVVVDPAGGSNKVAKVVKSATAESWAGTTVSTGANFSVDTIPFTATSTKMTVRVYSPRAGIPVRLKAEDAANNTHTVETEALTTQVNAWETLTFDFAQPANGTAALDLAYTYNKVSIFFDFGTTGAAGGGGTFYFDDVTFL